MSKQQDPTKIGLTQCVFHGFLGYFSNRGARQTNQTIYLGIILSMKCHVVQNRQGGFAVILEVLYRLTDPSWGIKGGKEGGI